MNGRALSLLLAAVLVAVPGCRPQDAAAPQPASPLKSAENQRVGRTV